MLSVLKLTLLLTTLSAAAALKRTVISTPNAPGAIENESRQAMQNVRAIIRSVPGASMKDVYECTVLMANLTEYAAFNLIYATYFSAPYPARAAYQVAQLPKGARVEVKCSAGL